MDDPVVKQEKPQAVARLDAMNYVHSAALLRLQDFANEVLRVIYDKSFQQKYMSNEKTGPDVFIITSSRRPHLYLEVFAKVPEMQAMKTYTHSFKSHPLFQKHLNVFAKRLDKSDSLELNRPWDVAVQMIMKVECVAESAIENPKSMVLRRESKVLCHLWLTFVRGKKGLQSMMGIPMPFDYQEVKHPAYLTKNIKGYMEIDMYGELRQLQPTEDCDGISRMRCITIEKLGPTIEYLLEVRGAALMGRKTFDFLTAFKIYDQIMCRLMQLHNRHIIYGNLGTRTLSFGRDICYNILYLNNFSKAVVIKLKPKNGHPNLVSNIRFASYSETECKSKHPFQDVESAFYLLVSMLSTSLPWDEETTETKEKEKERAMFQLLDDEEDVAAEEQQDLERAKRVKNMKEELWSCAHPKTLDLIVAGVRSSGIGIPEIGNDAKELFVTAIVKMHAIVKEMIDACFKPDASAHSFCVHINNTVSAEFQFYQRLRQKAVAPFYFTKRSPMFDSNGDSNSGGEKKDKIKRPSWDTANWCFLHLKILIPPQKPKKGL